MALVPLWGSACRLLFRLPVGARPALLPSAFACRPAFLECLSFLLGMECGHSSSAWEAKGVASRRLASLEPGASWGGGGSHAESTDWGRGGRRSLQVGAWLPGRVLSASQDLSCPACGCCRLHGMEGKTAHAAAQLGNAPSWHSQRNTMCVCVEGGWSLAPLPVKLCAAPGGRVLVVGKAIGRCLCSPGRAEHYSCGQRGTEFAGMK